MQLTQAELAQRVNYSVVTIRKIESEDLRPSLQIAERLAEQLEIPVEDRADFVRFARLGNSADALSGQDYLFGGLQHGAARRLRWTQPPVPPTVLIGREPEVAEVCELFLRKDTRLVTLTGTGGVGKTRLALEVADRLADKFTSGLCFVDLAPVLGVHLVIPAIAAALGINERPNTPLLDAIITYLQDKSLLVLLDNFEHLIPAAPVVAQLLSATRHLKMLVTSREVLGLRGEIVYHMPPLRSPTPSSGPSDNAFAGLMSIEELSQYPAIALFVGRAKAVQADFALSVHNAAAVIDICARLEGLPLAIELAAAHIRLFPPRDLADRLDSRLSMLVGGPQDLPARQRTLRATLAWSYDLLGASEQRLFRRLAVFVGGCSLEAAESVCYPPPQGGGASAFAALVESLLDKNLLWRREDERGHVRINMLDMIREYASEQLDASGEADVLRRRHAEYFLGVLETVEPELRGPNQTDYLAQLDTDHDNVRAALRYALDSEPAALALRLVGALRWFWTQRSHISEGYNWAMAALARSDTPLDTPTPARARALWCAGVLAWLLDEAVAFKLLVDSVELWRTLGDKRGLAYSLQHLGLATLEQADPERALSLELESLTLFRAEGDRLGESLAMLCLAEAANECGDYESEGRWLAECVRASRETQDTWVLALALRHLGRLAITRREFALARPPLEESIQLFLKMGTTHELAGTLDVAATMESEAGDNARAVRLWQQAVVCWRDLGVARGAAKDLRNLGRIARIQGNYDSSRLWLGESLTLLRPAHDLEAVCALLREFGALALAEGESDRAAALYNAADGLLTQLTGAESTRAAGAPLDVSSPAARLQPTLKSKSDFMSLEQAIKYAIEEN